MTHLPAEPMKEDKDLDVIPEPNNLGEEARQLDAEPSGMVERVARAMCADLGVPPDDWHEEDGVRVYAWQKEASTAQAAIEAMFAPADAGETAKPWPYEGDALGPPRPDPAGPFLLIMHDEHQQGWLWMRRYRTKADALCIAANYTGKDQVWLFEVGQELDIGSELEGFWARIAAEPDAEAAIPSPPGEAASPSDAGDKGPGKT